MQEGILHVLLMLMIVNVMWNLPVLGQLTFRQRRFDSLLSFPTVARRQMEVARLRERLRIKKMKMVMAPSMAPSKKSQL